MNLYAMLIHLPFRLFILFALISIPCASNAELYFPFGAKEGKIDFLGNHCVNEREEARLWSAINQYSNSFLIETPSIPPEQAKYIKEESTASTDRFVRLLSNPIYVMSETRQSVENIKMHAQAFMDNQRSLTLAKKVEFIGRVMINLEVETFPLNGAGIASAALSAKGYFVSEKILADNRTVFYLFRKTLIRQLICYGEIQK
jgi:hypothetical protein